MAPEQDDSRILKPNKAQNVSPRGRFLSFLCFPLLFLQFGCMMPGNYMSGSVILPISLCADDSLGHYTVSCRCEDSSLQVNLSVSRGFSGDQWSDLLLNLEVVNSSSRAVVYDGTNASIQKPGTSKSESVIVQDVSLLGERTIHVASGDTAWSFVFIPYTDTTAGSLPSETGKELYLGRFLTIEDSIICELSPAYLLLSGEFVDE